MHSIAHASWSAMHDAFGHHVHAQSQWHEFAIAIETGESHRHLTISCLHSSIEKVVDHKYMS